MNVAYIRVSTVEQNEARQVEAMKQYNIERFFTEKASAKDTNRPELKEMIKFVREGDTVYIHSFDRLARSTRDLLDIVEQLQEKGVHLHSNKENIDTSTPTGKLMLTMIGAIAEFERQNLLERQREGIAIAKQEGRYKGRQRITKPREFEILLDNYMKDRTVTKTDIAKQLGISRPTLDAWLKDYLERGKLICNNGCFEWNPKYGEIYRKKREEQLAMRYADEEAKNNT